MKAMILAAGRGERMRPLTDATPKPLLTVNDKPLLQHQLERLVAVGIVDIVINTWWLGEQIQAFVGDGSRFGARVSFSPEPNVLETGGGILQALPLLGDAPFLVTNGDIFTAYDFGRLLQLDWSAGQLAHLVLVDNPAHHPTGDFSLAADGRCHDKGEAGPIFTFSCISVLSPKLFAACAPGKFRLAPLLRHAMAQGKVGAEYYGGSWADVGTVQRLEALQAATANAGNMGLAH